MTATTVPTPRPRSRTASTICTWGLAGLVGWGAAPIVGHPAWAWPVLFLAVVGMVAAGLVAKRADLRTEQLERASLALRDTLGLRPADPLEFQARRWTHGWPGQPRLLKISYPPQVADNEPGWLGEITSALEPKLGTYRCRRHDGRRGRLVLKLVDTDVQEAVAAPAVQRAKRLVADLIGPTTKITHVDVDAAGEVTAIEATHQAGAKLVPTGYRARIERTVSTMLPGRFRAFWDMQADTVRFEQRPTLPESIWIDPLDPPSDDPLENYDAVEIPFGVDEDGEVMTWRPAISPQVIITGGTGSGKTSTTHAFLTRIAQYGWPIWVADGKAVEFLGFRDWPNVQVVASTIEHQIAVIHRAWELMEHRYSLITSGHARVEDFEPLVVFVDEFADLRGNLLSWYSQIKVKGDPTKPLTLAEVASLARKGRTSRVHVVLATQRPDAEFLGGEMRDNFTMRISVGRLSPKGAEMMWENPAIGVTLPRGRRGRAMAINSRGIPVEMQCYRTPDPSKVRNAEEVEILASLRPETSQHERLLILPLDDQQPDLDTGEILEPTFTDYANAAWGKATDHPRLDPLNLVASSSEMTGRQLSSPLAMLGLDGASAARPKLSALAEAAGGSGGHTATPGGALEAAGPPSLTVVDEDGYGEARALAPSSVAVGDLIYVDDAGTWAVVDDDPMEDIDNPDDLVLTWRDDDDDCGQIILAGDDVVQARRPIEEED